MQKKLMFVWGDSGQLGQQITSLARSRGYEIIGASRTPLPKADHTHLQADILTNIEGTLARVCEVGGVPDVVINATGAFSSKPLTEVSDEEISLLANTNLVAPIKLTRALQYLYAKEGKDSNLARNRSILHIGSAGMFPEVLSRDSRTMALYCGTKAALGTFSIAASKELREIGVRINTLVPSYFTNDLPRTQQYAKLCMRVSEELTSGMLIG